MGGKTGGQRESGGDGNNFKSFTTAAGRKEAAAIPQTVLKDRASNFFAKPVGSRAGGVAEGSAEKPPVGSAGGAAGGCLRRAEQQLADKLLLTVDANSEHGVIKVMEAGRWPSSEQRHAGGAGFVAAQRRDREEEEDGVEDPVPDDGLGKEWYYTVHTSGRNVPLRIGALWVKAFRAGKVPQAAGKPSVNLAFKIVQDSVFGTPAWQCWDFDAGVEKQVFSGASPHALLAKWMKQSGSGVSMGSGGGPSFVGISCVELQTFLRNATPGFDEQRLQRKSRQRSAAYWSRDTSQMSESSQKRRAAEACGVFEQAMSSKDEDRPQDVFWWAQRVGKFRRIYGDVSAARDRADNKMLPVMKRLYEDAVADNDFRAADIQLGTFASAHTLKETVLAFNVGVWRIKRAKKRVRLGMRLMLLTGKRHVSPLIPFTATSARKRQKLE
jgi:hypothetical protein|mmetsp:Transcript_63714/g.145987  ORF Transcript_63714/g.145987 Transcript_63714/m.145987 type:complete len:439 (+) Transcript_63714:161-1477(+)